MSLATREPEAFIERDRALNFARMLTRRAWAGGVTDMQGWATAEIEPEPLLLHDLNGQPLFYEFTARSGRHVVGRVKAAASGLVGAPVVTIDHGPRKWDDAAALKMATASAKKAFPGRDVVATDFVCYSYPKVGVRVEVSGEDGGSVIYDVADGSQVQQFGSDAPEGQSAWSFLDSIPTDAREGKLRSFDGHERELEAARDTSPEIFSAAYTAREAAEIKERLALHSDYIAIPFYSEKVLKYAPRCSPHDCFALY